MLWDGSFASRPGAETIWSISGTYLSLKECSVGLEDTVSAMRRRGHEVTDPLSGTSVYKMKNNTRGYLHCLPDTVDPRRPKGSAR